MTPEEREAIVDEFLGWCVTDSMNVPDDSGISNLSHMDGDQCVRFRYDGFAGGPVFVAINLVVSVIEPWDGGEIFFESRKDLSQNE